MISSAESAGGTAPIPGSPRPAGPILFLVAGLALAAYAIVIARLPLDSLLGIVPDDAFYYLQIARHIAASGFSSFDGINPTNGYHPAWMGLMTLCAGVVADREMLLRVALLLGVAFHAGTSLVLVRIFRRLLGESWGWIGGALWLINPFPLLLNLQGVETPFYFLALALLIDYATGAILPLLPPGSQGPPAPRTFAIFGLLLGLAFWGRSEMGVTGGMTVLLMMWWLRRHGIRPALRAGLLMVGSFTIAVLPWFIFSLLTLGTPAQDSGAMKMIWAAGEYGALAPFRRANEFGAYLYQGWFGRPVGLMLGTPHILRKIVPILLGLLLVRWVVRYRRDGMARPLLLLTIWLMASTLVTGAVYGAIITDPQIWHCGQPGLFLYIVAVAWGGAAQQRWNRRWLPGVILPVVALGLLIHFIVHLPERYPWQRDVYRSQSRFEALVPPGERIGSFNAGIPGYFGGRPVVNLDGLVNHAVVAYWQRHAFEGYLRDARIGYIADEADAVARAERFSSDTLALFPIDSVKLQGWGSGRRFLWRVGPFRTE